MNLHIDLVAGDTFQATRSADDIDVITLSPSEGLETTIEAYCGLEADALTFSVTEVDITTVDEGGDALSSLTASNRDQHLYRDTNVMVVLNYAGLMEDTASTQIRIGAAKAVLANLLHSYDTSGEVRVTVVLFNGGTTLHFPWGSVAGAIASLDKLMSEHPASYSDAQAAWTASGKLCGDTADVVYILSDGEPIIGGGSSIHLGEASTQTWHDFLGNPQNRIDHVYAVGIGSKIRQAQTIRCDPLAHLATT